MEKVISIVIDGLIFLAQILLLIGVHELGHLLFSKLAKIPVDKFSIGFGPAIVKWKIGSTEYQVAVIPLGGFVKFKGEDFDDPEGFYSFPYWRKSVSTLGGVVFNLFLAVIAYLVMGLAFGVSVPSATLDFTADSPLGKTGFQVGDSIVSVNNENISGYADLVKYFKLKDSIEVKAVQPAKELLVTVPPPDSQAPLIFLESLKFTGTPDSALLRYGFQSGDSITQINGIRTINTAGLSGFFPYSDTLRVRLSRPGKLLDLRTTGKDLSTAQPLAGPVVGRVVKKTPADDAGLKVGDVIVEAGGRPINHWNDFAEVVNLADTSKPIEVIWLHAGDTVKAGIKPVEMRFLSQRYTGIGVTPLFPSRPMKFGEAFWLPVKRTGEVSYNIIIALADIVRKPTNLKGVISLARYTSQFRRWGFDLIIAMIASLSITLAIINLLPIPALDGGRILMFTIEKIRRRQFGKQAWTWAVNIGFILVIALIAWTIVSDIFFPS